MHRRLMAMVIFMGAVARAETHFFARAFVSKSENKAWRISLYAGDYSASGWLLVRRMRKSMSESVLRPLGKKLSSSDPVRATSGKVVTIDGMAECMSGFPAAGCGHLSRTITVGFRAIGDRPRGVGFG